MRLEFAVSPLDLKVFLFENAAKTGLILAGNLELLTGHAFLVKAAELFQHVV